MSSINITDKIIQYESDFETSDQDASWTLDVSEICVIGFINRMNGDDDSDFVVFIDRTLKKYFINIARPIEAWSLAVEKIEKKFNINFKHQIYDSAIVLYPKALSFRQLYRKSFIKSLKTTLAVNHVAEGDLDNEIVNYIQKITSVNKC